MLFGMENKPLRILVPPRAPIPIVKEINHYSVELEWGEYLDRLCEVFTRDDGRISVEVQIRMDKRDDWELLYAGYGRFGSTTNLEAETKYQVRMRFRNKHGVGQFSPHLDVTTTKRPLTGVDIHKAIRMEDEIGLRKVLDLKEANIEAQDDLGFTPLQVACNAGRVKLVEVLLEHGADTENPSDTGKTALMCAAYKDHTTVLQRLIECGADIEKTDKNGLAPIHVAVDAERWNATSMLLKAKANVNVVDPKLLWTPLHRVAGLKNNGNSKIAQLLIQHKAIVDAEDRDGKTPLMLAAINGHQQLTEVLLEAGADLMKENQMGHNVMRLAEANDRRMVKKSIEDFLERQRLRNEALRNENT